MDQEIQIIRKVKNGQLDQYQLLVDRYSPMVFLVVRGFVNNEEDGEAMAQQIFVKAYDCIDSFNPDEKFSTWLYSLAINHCRDYTENTRQTNRQSSQIEEHEADSYITQDQSLEEEMGKREWPELIKEGLRCIKPKYSEALLYKYRDKMSYKAMSERLNAPVSALKERVFRAKKELKDFIETRSRPI